jgi:uncharacterized protein (TIGR02453 family)
LDGHGSQRPRDLAAATPDVRVDDVLIFNGFSDRVFDFYDELAANNSRSFWAEHKTVYETQVRDPMRALVTELEPEFGEATLFRPYRDVRFSKDKSPYKTHQGAFVGIEPGIGYYVQIDSGGLLAGGGFHHHASAQVERYRKAVDGEATGAALLEIASGLRDADFELEGEQLKTKPRGYAADHPRIDLLRFKSLMGLKRFGAPDWLATPATVDHVREAWRRLVPLNEWVLRNVGPPDA